MKSLFPDICTDDVRASRDFYAALFGFEPVFEVDWYVQLRSPDDPSVQIAFVRRDHPSVPAPFQVAAAGVFVTFEVDDVDVVHRRALEQGREIVYELRDEPWGQRHFIARDPNGLPVDVVQIIPPSPEFLSSLGRS